MVSAYLFDQRRGERIEAWQDALGGLTESQVLWLDLHKSEVFGLCRYCGDELVRPRRPLEICAKCERPASQNPSETAPTVPILTRSGLTSIEEGELSSCQLVQLA
jgi:hypothetical protein